MMWSLLICSIVVLPRIKATEILGQAILLDELFLGLVVGIASAKYIAHIAVIGKTSVIIPRVWGIYLIHITWKLVVLLVGAFVIGIADSFLGFYVLGEGVQIKEGLLVVVKSAIFLGVFSFTFLYLDNEHKCREAIRVYFGSVLVISIIAVIQLVVFNNDVVTSTFRNIHILSLAPPYGFGMEDPWFCKSAVGHEHLGAFIVMSSSLVLGQVLLDNRLSTINRFYKYILLALCVFCLIFSSSRGAWIGFGFSLLAWLWYAYNNDSVYKLFAGFIGFAVIVILIEYFGEIDVFRYVNIRVEGLLSGIDGEITDDSAKIRLQNLQDLLSIFWQFPIAGLGAGGLGRIGEGQYIRELIEGGIIGFLVFSVLILGILSVSLQVSRLAKCSTVRGFSIGYFCGTIGILGQSLFTDLLILTKVGVPFWFVAGIMQSLHLYSIEANRRSKKTS